MPSLRRMLTMGISSSESGESSGKRKEKRKRSKKEIEAEYRESERRLIESTRDLEAGLERMANEAKVEKERREEEQHAMILMEDEEALRRKGMVMDKVEQNSEKYDISMGTMGLVDRLEAHPAGKLLKNVVISNEPPPDRELNVTRLRRYKPQNDFSKLTLGDIPAFKLSEEYLDFPITDAMTQVQYDQLKQYVLVSDVFIHYVPLDSFFSVSSPVTIQLNDFRKVDNTVMREYPLTHSGGYNILMTLDYCVAKEDLKHLTLSISTSLASFRKGAAWASVKVLLTVSHMDFPVKANIQETMGVLHLADSDLADYISDPRSSDGVITPQAFSLLKNHYKRGEIENINLPRDDKKEVNVAKTAIGDTQSSTDVRDIMASMREQHLLKQREENNRTPTKPSIKRNFSSPSSEGRQSRVSDDDDDSMNELKPEDSGSHVGSDTTFELPRNDKKEPRSMRSVNFG